MERHFGVLVGDTAHFDEVAVCGVCGAVLWVSFVNFFLWRGGEGRDGEGMGWDEWIMGKGKGENRRGGREKEEGCIWIMESKSADSCG